MSTSLAQPKPKPKPEYNVTLSPSPIHMLLQMPHIILHRVAYEASQTLSTSTSHSPFYKWHSSDPSLGLKTLILTLASRGGSHDGEIMMEEGKENATAIMAEANYPAANTLPASEGGSHDGEIMMEERKEKATAAMAEASCLAANTLLASGDGIHDSEIMMEEEKEKAKAKVAVAEASRWLLMHYRVRRMWEEELRITDEGRRNTRDHVALLYLGTHVDATLSSRSPPILLSSPLKKKAVIGSSLL